MNDDTDMSSLDDRSNAMTAAAYLDQALGAGSGAQAYLLDGIWYVVTSGTGEGYDFAYEVEDVDVVHISEEGWDYSAWCSQICPVEDRRVAAAYFLETGGNLLGTVGSCKPVLTDGEREVLYVALDAMGEKQ